MEIIKKQKIAVIGAGISGLTASYLLKSKGIEVVLFERTHRAGGYAGSKTEAGFTIENGPNGFLNNEPKTLELVKLLGLENDLIKAKDKAKERYIYIKGQLHKVPLGPKELLKTKLFSWGTKFKMFKEYKFPPSFLDSSNERTMFDFVKDHFGDEMAENVIRPVVVGIFGGDAKKLSINKAMPKMVAMEKEHRSLIKAMKSQAQKSEKTVLMSFKGGIQTLIDTLVKKLGSDLKLNSYVIAVKKHKDGFQVTYQDEIENETFTEDFKDIIICLPPQSMPEILKGIIDEITLEKLSQFPTAPIKTLSIAFQAPLNFTGFGTLISPNEDMKILGFLHPKDIFENRCPENKDLITVMMGGTFHPQAVNWSLQNGLKISLECLEKILGKLPPIEKYWVWNHNPGIPQYNTDWVDFMNHFSDQVGATKGLWLHSTVFGGVALNDCIRKSFELVEKFNPNDYVTKINYNTESTDDLEDGFGE